MAIPHVGAGHTLPVVFPALGDSADLGSSAYSNFAVLLLANFNSVILDYLARQKVHGNHLAWYLIEQLPILKTASYRRYFGPKTAHTIVRDAVLELTYTSHDMAPFALDLGYVDQEGNVLPPFRWDDNRRSHLRAKLDAVYFHLYGVTNRDDVLHIFSTFPIVEREDLDQYGTYRSRELCLAYMSALTAGDPNAQISL
jgi:hypothetical protein